LKTLKYRASHGTGRNENDGVPDYCCNLPSRMVLPSLKVLELHLSDTRLEALVDCLLAHLDATSRWLNRLHKFTYSHHHGRRGWLPPPTLDDILVLMPALTSLELQNFKSPTPSDCPIPENSTRPEVSSMINPKPPLLLTSICLDNFESHSPSVAYMKGLGRALELRNPPSIIQVVVKEYPDRFRPSKVCKDMEDLNRTFDRVQFITNVSQ